MLLVVRKIEYSKWMQRKILEGEQPSADAITNCMKTTSNTLSLWSINDKTEINEAILAIGSNFNSLDSIDILTIDLSLITSKGLSIQKCVGQTPYKCFEGRHLDVISLDYKSLGVMAEVIIDSIRHGFCQRVLRKDLKAIISKGVEEGKIQWSDLKENIQKLIPPKGTTPNSNSGH